MSSKPAWTTKQGYLTKRWKEAIKEVKLSSRKLATEALSRNVSLTLPARGDEGQALRSQTPGWALASRSGPWSGSGCARGCPAWKGSWSGSRARSGVSSRRKIEPLLTLLSTTLGASAKQKGLESRVRPGLGKLPGGSEVWIPLGTVDGS